MQVFLSYTRKKDLFHKVSLFRDHLEAELDSRSPGAVVFQDKKNIEAGQHFPEVIEEELNRSDVLLALVSPAWLKSEWCRREFSLFTNSATDEDRLHRILPVLWVETPDLDGRSLDLVNRTIARINYSDWRDVRYENWDSAALQRQIGQLADSVVSMAGSTRLQNQVKSASTERLEEESEAILLTLNQHLEGLSESGLTRLTTLSRARVAVCLHELSERALVSVRLRVGQPDKHWKIRVEGQKYLLTHGLAA